MTETLEIRKTPMIEPHPFHHQLAEEAPALLRLARHLTRNEHYAQDLAQETLRKAWSARGGYQPGARLRGWLFTILRNTHVSDLRKHRREVEDADGSLAAALSQEGAQEHAMALRELGAAMRDLTCEQREALMLVGGAGYSHEEAAIATGCAVGTIKSRVSRARARLGEALGISTQDASTPARRPPSFARTHLRRDANAAARA